MAVKENAADGSLIVDPGRGFFLAWSGQTGYKYSMKTIKMTAIAVLFASVCLFSGCEDTNLDLAVEAGIDAVKAATLSDKEVKMMAVKASQASDTKNRVAPADNAYARRLVRLVGTTYADEGYTFNFKVYLTDQVNAFAMADGTIRIYAGLMDMMDDDELRFVIGHEIGHVVKKHIKKKIQLAYAASAVRKGVASQGGSVAGDIARSSLGGLVEALLNAQFSQEEERQADDYGILYLKKSNRDIRAAVSALNKLATLGKGHSFLSSHPAPEARAKRLAEQVGSPEKIGGPTFFENIFLTVKNFILDKLNWN